MVIVILSAGPEGASCQAVAHVVLRRHSDRHPRPRRPAASGDPGRQAPVVGNSVQLLIIPRSLPQVQSAEPDRKRCRGRYRDARAKARRAAQALAQARLSENILEGYSQPVAEKQNLW
jgi:hypothetical protein